MKMLDIFTVKLGPGERRDLRGIDGHLVVLARSDDGKETSVVLYEEEVESPAPEPAQKKPLQDPDGEAPARDSGVGAPGPLPDALLQEGEVIEGVGSDMEGEWRACEAIFVLRAQRLIPLSLAIELLAAIVRGRA